jgi:broad specificity phosphatase PhoE
LKLPIQVDDALREYDCGDLEGKTDAESWRLHTALKNSWLIDRHLHRRIDGGESYLDTRARFQPFIESLMGVTSDNEAVLLVGHGGTYQCMLPALCTNLNFDAGLALPFPNTGYVLVESRQKHLFCREWCGIRMEQPGS